MKRLKILFMFVLIMIIFTGCGNTKISTENTVKRIVLVAKHEGIPWFDDMRKGVEEFGKKMGDKVSVSQIAPEGGDPAKQVAMVEDLIAQKVDAIVVVPNDPDSMRPILQRAKENGIVVISHEAAGLANVVDYDIEAFSNKEFGERLFNELAIAMDGKGKFATMVGGLTMETHMEWYNYGMEYLKKNYPDMTVISAQPYEDKNDDKIARDKAIEILNANPDLKGFVGTSVSAGSNMSAVLKEKNNTDVKVVSLGIPSVSCPYLDEGYMVHAQTWRPADVGYAAVNLAYKILNKEEVKEGLNLDREGYEAISIDGKIIFGNAPMILKKGTYKLGDYPF